MIGRTKQCSKCLQIKGVSEFYVARNKADGLQARCKRCQLTFKSIRNPATRRAWDAENRQKCLESKARYYAKHKVALLQKMAVYHQKVKDRRKRVTKEFIEKNYEYFRARSNEATARWTAKNLHLHAASQKKRELKKRNATPAWANDFFMKEAYHLARLRTEATGIKWSVDHIVPIKSSVVCGLHVEHNLRVMPHISNIKKGNKLSPSAMEERQWTF